MYQYLRVKKDSVTSILLFIFNVFLVERGDRLHSLEENIPPSWAF